MEAQKAVDELATYLLGDDYYIVDPVSESQANDIDEIKSRYRGFTESPTNRWWNSRCNRRCKFCKHYIEFSAINCQGTCRAKYQLVYGSSRRPFCKVFQIKPFYEKEEK